MNLDELIKWMGHEAPWWLMLLVFVLAWTPSTVMLVGYFAFMYGISNGESNDESKLERRD